MKNLFTFLSCLLLAVFLGSCSSPTQPDRKTPLASLSGTRELRNPPSPITSSPSQPVPSTLVPPSIPTNSPTPSPSSVPSPRPPSSTPTPLPCWQEGGRIVTGSLPTDSLTEPLPDPLEFRVYLPPCYDKEPNRRYPTLYLIHGQSYTDDQWDRLGADEAANTLIASGEAVPFLIVMPRDRRWDQPYKDHFGIAVADVLVPWIDANYRTQTGRSSRAVGGLSRGAGWAVHLALSRWELFGALGAHSLPVFWEDTYHIKEWLNAIPTDQMPRIYMDNPNNDRSEILKSSIWFEKLLTQRGIPHEWRLFTGYHEEKYWRAHVEQYLRWYAKGWEE